jgi:hypothetical protein
MQMDASNCAWTKLYSWVRSSSSPTFVDHLQEIETESESWNDGVMERRKEIATTCWTR